jgi:hypothetical protein
MRLFGKKVEGLIGFYKLSDWWLSTFAEQERQYIEKQYRPMGLPASSLTQGKVSSSQQVTDFLNILAMGKEETTAKKIRQKMDELARNSPLVGPGACRGRHYTTYVEEAKELKRSGKLAEAETLLLELVKATEAEDKKERRGVAPWYYQELALIYRKRKDYVSEVKILERFAKQRHGPGVSPPLLLERLAKARALLEAEKNRS